MHISRYVNCWIQPTDGERGNWRGKSQWFEQKEKEKKKKKEREREREGHKVTYLIRGERTPKKVLIIQRYPPPPPQHPTPLISFLDCSAITYLPAWLHRFHLMLGEPTYWDLTVSVKWSKTTVSLLCCIYYIKTEKAMTSWTLSPSFFPSEKLPWRLNLSMSHVPANEKTIYWHLSTFLTARNLLFTW